MEKMENASGYSAFSDFREVNYTISIFPTDFNLVAATKTRQSTQWTRDIKILQMGESGLSPLINLIISWYKKLFEQRKYQ